jgi:hypothetical protein
MSLIDQKKKVFGNIAAAKTLVEGMPKLKLNSSFPSINNSGDAIAFLTDLIKSLIGFEALQQSITDILVHYSKPIEQEVKNLLKSELKSIVSCGVDPSLPAWIKSTGSGIKIVTHKIDFTDMMMVDPNSEAGKLMYKDLTPNLINSSDFNTFLYQTIQNNGNVETWGLTTAGHGILNFTFKATDVSGIDPNNTITIKADPSYNNKTLTDLNNDYIDSITLFDLEHLMTNLFDMVFGTLSSAANKSIGQLESQIKINTVVDKISNADSKDIISNKYFDFSDKEKLIHQQDANLKKVGINPQDIDKKVNTSVPLQALKTTQSDINAAGNNAIQTKNAVVNSLNSIGNQVSAFANSPSDKQTLKSNFIQELINNLIKVIVNSILSPKVIAIFVINFKIIYGPTEDFGDAIDFMKKNKNLIHNIIKRISGLILQQLLKIAMKKISELVAQKQIKKLEDMAKAKVAQLLTLVGVPQEVIRKLKGLL